jgi:hypothetical protein
MPIWPAQAVSRRLPTAATLDRFQVRPCGICGGQIGSGADFLRILWFPLSVLIPRTVPYSSVILYSRPTSGRRSKCGLLHLTT